MGNHMNRNRALSRIGCVKHAPVTDARLKQAGKGPCQRLGLDLVEVLGEPLEFFGDASRERSSIA